MLNTQEVSLSRKFSPVVLAGIGLATSFLAADASAHIELVEPRARYDITGFDMGIKSCPCGLGGSNRTCNVGQDGSDPDRATDRVSRFEAGSTIVLRFNEYVDHSGRFRVAFDPSGADMADFNANILSDIPDPANTGGQTWEMEVTLPDTPCSNCTLQLVQAMHGDTVNPVTDPAPLSSYYTCIDVELVAPGPSEGGEAMDPGSPTPDPGGMQVDPMSSVDGGAAASNVQGEERPLGPNPTMDSMMNPSAAPATSAPAGSQAMGSAAMPPLGGASGPAAMSMSNVFDGTQAPSGASSSSACNLGTRGRQSGVSWLSAVGLSVALGVRRRRLRRARA